MRVSAIRSKRGETLTNWWKKADVETKRRTISKMADTKRDRPGPTRLPEDEIRHLLSIYRMHPEIVGVDTVGRNGRIVTYDRAFAKKYSTDLISSTVLYNIISGKVLAWKHLL